MASMKKLILASGSPRRRQLLTEAGFVFDTLTLQISETLNENLILDERIKAIAEDKARAAAAHLRGLGLDASKNPTLTQKFTIPKYSEADVLILTADTVVVLNGEVLGKPIDTQQAFLFLSRLSNAVHEVKTAVGLFDFSQDRLVLGIETSKVKFRNLQAIEIEDYIATGDPMDKAGAYGIQGHAGQSFIVGLEGRRDNVMGLSIACVERMLAENAWTVERQRVDRGENRE